MVWNTDVYKRQSFQFVCKLQRACGGLLGDCQQYGMLTAFRGGTQFRKFGSDLNVGNIFQQDRGTGDPVAPHHGLGYLVYLVGRKYAAYDKMCIRDRCRVGEVVVCLVLQFL